MTIAAAERVMCDAVPVAARRWGRTDQGCASRALSSVWWDGVERHLCGMHQVTWEHASRKSDWAERHAELAENWGWNA